MREHGREHTLQSSLYDLQNKLCASLVRLYATLLDQALYLLLVCLLNATINATLFL